MATQVSARNACWLDGIAVAAQDLRDGFGGMLTSTGATGTTGIAATAGVRYSVGTPLACTWTSGMSFNLSAGVCFVQGSASATAGLYELVLDTTALLTVTASDPTNPRIDSVIATVVDNGNNTSTAVFKILAGTPAGSPVAPTLPANALLLCSIAVAANAVTLSAGVFTDKRVWTAAHGGILPVANAPLGSFVGGPPNSYIHDLTAHRLRMLDNAGNVTLVGIAANSPSSSVLTTSQAVTAGTVTSIGTIFAGPAEIEISVSYYGISEGTPVVGHIIQHTILLDATQVGGWQYRQDSTSGQNGGGMTYTCWTTVTAGTHFIYWQTNPTVSSNFTIQASTGTPAVLRVNAAFG